MIIEISTDRSIKWDEQREVQFNAMIAERLDLYRTYIARIEVHLSDESLEKKKPRDIKCVLEANLQGFQQISVTMRSDSEELALLGAISKLSSSVKSTIDRITEHRLYRDRR